MIGKILDILSIIFFISILLSLFYTIWFDHVIGLKLTASSILLFIAQFLFDKVKNDK